MPSLPKKLIDTAAGLAGKAADLAGRVLRDEDDTTVPAAAKPETSPAPDAVGAPKPGAPAAPKSATARTSKPKAKAKPQPSGRGAVAKAGPNAEPLGTANAAAATATEGAVPTGEPKRTPAREDHARRVQAGDQASRRRCTGQARGAGEATGGGQEARSREARAARDGEEAGCAEGEETGGREARAARDGQDAGRRGEGRGVPRHREGRFGGEAQGGGAEEGFPVDLRHPDAPAGARGQEEAGRGEAGRARDEAPVKEPPQTANAAAAKPTDGAVPTGDDK